jgi:hypothetical protein
MKKITLSVLLLLFSLAMIAQSTINVTTTGGSFTSEKWVSITTEVDGAGTQIFGQGDGSYGNGAGLINQDISLAPGTYFVNCYDSFSDGWDGTLISVTAYGAVIGDNGGVSPSDGTDTDADGTFEDPAIELEVSFSIVVPEPPSCLPPTSLAALPSSTTDVDITWSAGSTETQWTYEFGISPYAQGDGGTSGTVMTTTELSLSGLTPGETYDIYIQANCGGADGDSTYATVQWSQPNAGELCVVALSATVEADCSMSTPLSLDFDAGGSETLTSCDAFGNTGYWVEITTPVNGAFNINLAGSATSVGVAIYDACGGNEVFCSNNTLDATTELTDLDGSTLYYLYFWQDTTSGVAEICFEEVSCVSPGNLAVSVTSNTEAEISWDENNQPPATAWEYVVQAPDTGEPMASGTMTMSNTAPISGLTNFDSYEFYVRADCGGSFSDWSGPFEWFQVTPPANDECTAAEALTVNADLNNGVVTAGTTAGATASPQADDVSGTPNTDVWYSFDATNEEHRVQLLNVVNQGGGTSTSTDMGMGVYDSTAGCDALVFTATSDPDILNLTGLTIGTTYVVRVYGWFTSVQNNNFDISVGTPPPPPPPPANDECDDAVALTVNLDYDNTMVTAGTTVGATASAQADDVSGTPNTDVWYTFEAIYDEHRVQLLNVVNQGGGTSTSTDMGMGVYDLTGGCGALVFTATSDPNTLNLTGLTPGTTYAVRVYGWFTSVQFNNFDVSVGSDPALSTEDFNNPSTFTYFPNPVKNTLTLNAQNTIDNVTMYNMLGQEVLRATPNAVDSDLDMSSLQTGTYFVKVTIANTTQTIRVIKQ